MLYNDLLRGSHMLGIICVAVAVSLCVVDILFVWHIVIFFVKMYIVLVVRYVFILGQRISVFIGHDYRIEKELPMAYVFYGQDSLVENDKRYDEIGIFLRSSHFLKNLEKHVQKAEAIIYGR